MRSDIEIANSAKIEKITNIAKKLGIEEDEIELYGSNKAKLSIELLKRDRKQSRWQTDFGERDDTPSARRRKIDHDRGTCRCAWKARQKLSAP